MQLIYTSLNDPYNLVICCMAIEDGIVNSLTYLYIKEDDFPVRYFSQQISRFVLFSFIFFPHLQCWDLGYFARRYFANPMRHGKQSYKTTVINIMRNILDSHFEMVLLYLYIYPLVIKHGNGKPPMNGCFNRNITGKWSIFHYNV